MTPSLPSSKSLFAAILKAFVLRLRRNLHILGTKLSDAEDAAIERGLEPFPAPGVRCPHSTGSIGSVKMPKVSRKPMKIMPLMVEPTLVVTHTMAPINPTKFNVDWSSFISVYREESIGCQSGFDSQLIQS